MPFPSSSRDFNRPTFELADPLDQHDSIRTGPELLAFNAKHNAGQLYCLQAIKKADNGVSGFSSITFADMQRAVENCSAWLTSSIRTIQKPYRDESGAIIRGHPVALLLGSDIGLMIHLLALLYLGVPVVLLSARLSPIAIAHLLKATSAKSIVISSKAAETAKEAVDSLDCDEDRPEIYHQQSYEKFLPERFPSKTPPMCILVDEDDRNVLILHSSGTTGLPKPIYHTHKYLLGYAGCHLFPDDGVTPPMNLSTLPLYHGFGLLAPSLGLSVGMPFCLPSASTIPTAELVVELLKSSAAQSLMTVPSILEDLSRIPEGIASLLKLDFVAVGGGPIKPVVGEQLAATGVKLLNHAGATEIGAIAPIFRPTSEYDWHYLVLRKDIQLKLEPVETTEGPERHRLVGFPFGWGTRFEVQDLLECNPKHPDSQFKILGRNDDLIVLANGEKVLPRVIESAISELDNVKAAVAFGEGRFELGLIVEPVEELSDGQVSDFVESIWPAVLAANDQMDEHARVSAKAMVIVPTDGKSVPRSDKGSCMRKETYRIFENEISEAYQRLESTEEAVQVLDEQNLQDGLKQLVQRCIRTKRELGPDDDFFEFGMDSLQATRLHRLLGASVKTIPILQLKTLPRDFVFRFTTVAKMANALLLGGSAQEDSRTNRMATLVGQFTFPIPSSNGSVVLLTGSTGSLGAFLVEDLSRLASVDKIFCIIRTSSTGEDPVKRQQRAFSSRRINLSAKSWKKIEIIETDSKAPYLGLNKAVYKTLTHSITHIIHNAWPMDFNRTVESFEPHFRALQNLLRLATDAHGVRPEVRPRLLFTSSIAAVGMYPSLTGSAVVPEEAMDDPSVTDPFGYAEAKWVCEKMLGQVATPFADVFETTVVRIGQLTGSETSGVWNHNEHFPALLKSSQLIGRLPSVEGTLSWLPVDWAAKALVDILFNTRPLAQVYHLENPVRQSWKEMLGMLAEKLGLPDEHLPFEQWLESVQANENSENVARKLVTFFREEFLRMAGGGVILETRKAQEASEKLSNCRKISREIVEIYIDAWRSAGFLQ